MTEDITPPKTNPDTFLGLLKKEDPESGKDAYTLIISFLLAKPDKYVTVTTDVAFPTPEAAIMQAVKSLHMLFHNIDSMCFVYDSSKSIVGKYDINRVVMEGLISSFTKQVMKAEQYAGDDGDDEEDDGEEGEQDDDSDEPRVLH